MGVRVSVCNRSGSLIIPEMCVRAGRPASKKYKESVRNKTTNTAKTELGNCPSGPWGNTFESEYFQHFSDGPDTPRRPGPPLVQRVDDVRIPKNNFNILVPTENRGRHTPFYINIGDLK